MIIRVRVLSVFMIILMGCCSFIFGNEELWKKGTAEIYALDWTSLDTGKQLAYHDPTKILWRNVDGEKSRKVWENQKRVVIKDLHLRVSWNTAKPHRDATNKHKTTLFTIRNVEEVVIENVSILQMNKDYRGFQGILIEDCGKVTVRNCFFAGAVQRTHLRIEGCEEYLIERTEISGWDYGDGKPRAGGGILINNGSYDPKTGKMRSIYSPNPRNLRWGIVRDCYFHDNIGTDTGPWRNQDALLFHAPADGMVFNSVFERWLVGDACIDVSHRRSDKAYRDHIYRVERCIFRDCRYVKTNGSRGDPNSIIVWANNLYINCFLADYHRGWDNWHINETFAYTKRSKGFIRNWGMRDGRTIFCNALLYHPVGVIFSMFHIGKNQPADSYLLLSMSNMFYLMRPPAYWVTVQDDRSKGIKIRKLWLATGCEKESVLEKPVNCFNNSKDADYRPLLSSPVSSFGSGKFRNHKNPALRVDRDFCGKPRPKKPAVGAFEPGKEKLRIRGLL